MNKRRDASVGIAIGNVYFLSFFLVFFGVSLEEVAGGLQKKSEPSDPEA
jgi:hypothetical protein